VSKLQQYFLLLFRQQPPELWDARTRTLLKPLAATLPVVADVVGWLRRLGRPSTPAVL
jgi:hypothetical protein